MSDHNPDSNPNRSGTDRAREDRRLFPLRAETFEAAMQRARDARALRTATAAAGAVDLAAELAGTEVAHVCAPDTGPAEMWSVRGEVRCRHHFALPHPMDFAGGLPMPAAD